MSSRLSLMSLGKKEVLPPVVEKVSEEIPAVVPLKVERPAITERIIDDAVETVLAKTTLSEDVKSSFRVLLANDVDSSFATNYYLGKTREDSYVAATRLERKECVVRSVLTSDEMGDMVKYAPEYDLKFVGEENHDHGPAASMRKLDTRILLDSMPNVPFKDIGGDPLVYIMLGKTNAHVCDPFEDVKDPTRGTMRRMRAKKIRDDESWNMESRLLAARYLDRDPTFVCGKRGQDCTHKARYTISAHVYDIPMQDWPEVMHQAGSAIHVGTVHFSSDMYARSEGRMYASRAYYKIDAEADTFHMGFEGSPAWWYAHSWMAYMRYGVDQIIEHSTGRYSYKITQRRGDTLFFEVMKVDGSSVLQRQCYRMPAVKMVKVNGFQMSDAWSWDVAQGRLSQLQTKVWWFPETLWKDMLVQAQVDFERGVMTFDKLFNYYRTISPRNTINGVLLSGGNAVEKDMVVPLVVHVGVVAAAKVMMGQRETRMITNAEMLRRVASKRDWFNRVFGGFSAIVSSAGKGLSKMIAWLCSSFVNLTNDLLMESLVSWASEVDVQDVAFSSMVGNASPAVRAAWVDFQFEDVESIMLVPAHASIKRDHEDALESVPALREVVESLYGFSSGSEVSSTLVDKVRVEDSSGGDRVQSSASASALLERRAAVAECIEEAELEERKIVEHCEKVWRVCMDPHNQPIVSMLNSRAEEYGQPDFYKINGGVLNSSVLGEEPGKFKHSAVYVIGGSKGKPRFLSVRDQVVNEGAQEYECKVVDDFTYTGWAMVLDRLLIHNGPDIRQSLQRALELPFQFEVVLHQGPPGCGKTYSLLQAIQRSHVGMCPVRASADDTRSRLREKDEGFPDLRNRVSTVDSYLTNLDRSNKRGLRADVLHADESFMTHSGRWYAAASFLGVGRIEAYGDVNQIPHIPRVQAAALYTKLKPDRVIVTYVTYRCPWDAVAAWGHVYEWKVRSVSSVKHSMSTSVDWTSLTIPKGLVVLVMYQAGKKEARTILKSRIKEKRITIMSVHEAEGKTFQHVWLMKFDSRVRSDGLSLYDQSAHVLVAMSRHTDSFVYVRPRDVGDLVDKWVKQASDVRRVLAAGDEKSAGISKEF